MVVMFLFQSRLLQVAGIVTAIKFKTTPPAPMVIRTIAITLTGINRAHQNGTIITEDKYTFKTDTCEMTAHMFHPT